MNRKNIQHITISQKSEIESQELKKTPDTQQPTANFLTAEGIELKPTYSEEDLEGLEHIGFAAGFAPNLRRPYAALNVRRPWTIRHYAGCTTAVERNAFYRSNLPAGQKGLPVASGLVTQRGYDSD